MHASHLRSAFVPAFSLVCVLLTSSSRAEAVDTPRKPNPAAAASAANIPPHLAPAAQSDNKWRFKYHEGRWWYWMPDETWVFWHDNRWMHYDPSTFARTVGPRASTALAVGPSAGASSGSVKAWPRGFRGRGGYYYGNEANRPVAVPFFGFPGMSPMIN